MTIKQLHFEAAAQWRMSREDLNKSRYGDEIARLKVADGLAKKGLTVGKGVADSVLGDLKVSRWSTVLIAVSAIGHGIGAFAPPRCHHEKVAIPQALVLKRQDLHNAVKTALERAQRDNDLIYLSAIPPASQLAPIAGASMVKLATPTEVAEPTQWLMSGNAGVAPLFSALVPYGVHLALSES